MSVFAVQCPSCGKELKLRDRSKLGQKAKCPSCAKPFVLEDRAVQEQEVALELVEERPAVGRAAQWVPDDPPARGAAATTAAVRATGASPAALGSGSHDDPVKRLKEARLKAARRRNKAILFGGLAALVIGGGVWGFSALRKNDAPVAAAAPGAPVAAAPAAPQVAAVGRPPAPSVAGVAAPTVPLPVVSVGMTPDSVLLPHQQLTKPQLQDNEKIANQLAPRRGDPIRLYMIPSGMNVVIHLRPAKLWSDDPVWQELRYSLTEDVTNWIAAELKEHCRREPQQIEECLICLRLGAIGTEPGIASVVHFAQEEKLSKLIEEFSGAPLNEDGGPRINSAPPYAYLIKDTKTVAIAPEADKFELPEVITQPNPNPTEGIYRLLDLTDRERPFTILFELDDVKRHEKWLFSERTLPVFQQVLNWFGDDVETVAWSVDVQGDSAVSEILLRNRSVANSGRLAKDTLLQLEYLPQNLQSACLKMHPATKGFQSLIGRFPAMLEAYRQATVPTVDTRHVRLTTVLPRKAAPNLALGTLLAWDQSTHTDFSSAAPAPVVAAAAVDIPEKLEDRLKKFTFDGEFNNPFQDAIAYIASESKTEIDIDGNALKDAGFTKNMPIKLSLGKVNGLEALRQIILSEKCRPPVPEKRICIVVDEAAKKVIVSTEYFAKENGQTVYPLITP